MRTLVDAGGAVARKLSGVMVGICAVTALANGVLADAPGVAKSKSIGLLLTIWDPALYETADGKQECPEGMQYTNRDNWKAQFPTPEQQEEFNRRYVHLGPSAPGAVHPEVYLQNRGPNGANVGFNPTAVKDPLPFREVQGTTGYGLNLDNDESGAATANTCPHGNFTSTDGERGIDNQLYRLLGCAPGWRGDGINKVFHRQQVNQELLNRTLLEITAVDDERNDDHVVVTTYRGVDRIKGDASNKPIPGITYRVDPRLPQYIIRTTGKIVDGVLITEPMDWRASMQLMNADSERMLYGARMRLQLSEKDATGLVGGYEDLEMWYSSYARGYAPLADSISFWSPPAFYEAARRNADGKRDPVSGQCTALSAAYNVSFVRVHVMQPPEYDPIAIEARRLRSAATDATKLDASNN